MLKHILYCRKSSEDEDRQALSVEAQLSELNPLAAVHGLRLVDTLTESKSAKEPGRAVFNDMIRRIERGEANAILTWKLDRLARNFDDGGKIIGLLQRGVIKEIRTFEKVYLPTDNVLLIAVELGMANQYVRDLSVNIQRGLREKIRRGIFPGKATLGYLNEPRLRTIEPHPKYFKRMKGILELFASGKYTLTALRKEMAAAGLVGARTGKPPVVCSIAKLLRDPFYYGAFEWKGELHPGIHVPMISKQTFDKIQAALVTNGKPRQNRRDKGFQFRNFATCGSCGCSITAEKHVKRSGLRFKYYRCTRKSRRVVCGDRSFIREEKFHEEVRRNVGLVTIPDDWKERYFARIETWQAEAAHERQAQISRFQEQLAAITARIDRLNNAFADGDLGLAEFRELKNPLVPRKTELGQQIAALGKGEGNWLEPLREWVLQANQAEKWLLEDNGLEMKSFLQKVGSNRLLRAQTLTVSFLKPWHSLAQMKITASNATTESEQNDLWWSQGDSNS